VQGDLFVAARDHSVCVDAQIFLGYAIFCVIDVGGELQLRAP